MNLSVEESSVSGINTDNIPINVMKISDTPERFDKNKIDLNLSRLKSSKNGLNFTQDNFTIGDQMNSTR